MRLVIVAVVASTLILSGIASMASSASASQAESVSGTWGSAVLTSTDVTNQGGITTRIYVGTYKFFGDMAGTHEGEFSWIFNSRTGKGTIHGFSTFTGTVLGSAPGQITCVYSGTVEDVDKPVVGSTWAQKFTCDRGTEGLAGLYIHGAYIRIAGSLPIRTFSAMAHFES
ncbi:MAG TPA: hypothetical protein VIH27_02315 [Nitrososphaerales archaeon]